MQYRFERGERPVVHVGRRQLDVTQRRRAEGELVELLVAELSASEVQRRTPSCPRAELWHAGVGEGLASEQRAAVTAGAARLVAEEEQGAALLLGSQRGIVVLEIAIERRVDLGERLHLEGGDRRGRLLEAELAARRPGERGAELRHVLRDGEQAPHDRLPDRCEVRVAELRQLVEVPKAVA